MTDDTLILLTTLGGLALVATVFLPGQSAGWRVLCGVVGAAALVWMGWVYVVGGTYVLSPYFTFVPLLLIGQSLRTMLRARREDRPTPGPTPHHPAAGGSHLGEDQEQRRRPGSEHGQQ
ncbi:hypothetical protein J4H86_07830 [Spiractinospora alimapuensis]|uniref:hypothetical protein n=1 Tax=Spiractinospora alimapuensis TaxID=2820884 RepID=UPI001F2FB438|nr:hypothetical protein [Spiractinospora alimapuensis]QVQ53628.1 hypothetical protein J4H86_07830 [Spiractinospora alimapuensis]